MTHKIKIALLAAIFFCSTAAWSQTDDNLSKEVFKKITEAILKGDCDRAQRAYNVWKELTEKTNPDIEAEIEDCKNSDKKKPTPKLKIGQDFQGGRIAYLDDSGIHGWVVTISDVTNEAVYWDIANKTCKELTLDGYSNWRLPSREELKMILKHKKLFGMHSEYWSSTNYCTNVQERSSLNKYQVRAIHEF
jgi:hypothetical protein